MNKKKVNRVKRKTKAKTMLELLGRDCRDGTALSFELKL